MQIVVGIAGLAHLSANRPPSPTLQLTMARGVEAMRRVQPHFLPREPSPQIGDVRSLDLGVGELEVEISSSSSRRRRQRSRSR